MKGLSKSYLPEHDIVCCICNGCAAFWRYNE